MALLFVCWGCVLIDRTSIAKVEVKGDRGVSLAGIGTLSSISIVGHWVLRLVRSKEMSTRNLFDQSTRS